MGQYHVPVNLDKREKIEPHRLGAGLKQWEQIANYPSTPVALAILLFSSNHRGGGDLRDAASGDILGRWAGDRIAIIGDYGEDSDLPEYPLAGSLWGQLDDFTDVTDGVREIIEAELDGTFVGEGWCHFQRNNEEQEVA